MVIRKYHNSILLLLLIFITETINPIMVGQVLPPKSKKSIKIIGGVNARRHEFPFMVAIYYHSSYRCGGTIVSPSWIISAGHCYNIFYRNNLEVVAGMVILYEDHRDIQKRDVKKVIPHPKYNFNQDILINDIALLLLKNPLKFNKAVKSITLPNANQRFSGLTLLLGWGYTSLNKRTYYAATLQVITAPLIRLKECHENETETFILKRSMICILPYDKQSGCIGDSGSPLVQNGVFLGIMSWGDDDCGTTSNHRIPNVFTKVSHFIKFIEKYTKHM